MKEDKIFIDRFDDKTYSLSKFNGVEYVTDIAIVTDYTLENPSITFTTHTSLNELNTIIEVVKEQQKDVEIFGSLLIELNGNDEKK